MPGFPKVPAKASSWERPPGGSHTLHGMCSSVGP